MIERTNLVAILTIAVTDGGPLPRFSGNHDGAHQVIALRGRLLQQSADGIAVVKCSVIGPCGAVVFPRPGQSCGRGVVARGKQRDSAGARFLGQLYQPSKFAGAERNLCRVDDREIPLADDLIHEAMYPHRVVRRLTAGDEQMFIVSGSNLVIATVAATPRVAAGLTVKRDKANCVACHLGAKLYRHVVQQRSFAMDSLWAPIFRVAAQNYLFFAIHLEHGGGANLKVRDKWIRVNVLCRVQSFEYLVA